MPISARPLDRADSTDADLREANLSGVIYNEGMPENFTPPPQPPNHVVPIQARAFTAYTHATARRIGVTDTSEHL